MKKILSLFSLLALFLIGGANNAVADYYVGEQVSPIELEDGDLVIFEAGCSSAHYGRYLTDGTVTDGRELSDRRATRIKEGLTEAAVWRVISANGIGRFYLQSVSSGYYYSKGSDLGSMTDNFSSAEPLQTHVFPDATPYSGTQRFVDYSGNPAGWNAKSTALQQTNNSYYLCSDNSDMIYGDHSHARYWNIFRVSTDPSKGTALSAYDGTRTKISGVTIDGLTYDLTTINTPSGGVANFTTANRSYSETTLHIPATVTYNGKTYRVNRLSGGAFQGATFTNIEFESPIFMYIGSWAFAECNNVTEVVVPEGITFLASDRPFSKMDNLETVTLPSTIRAIENYSFASDPNLTTLIFKGETPPMFKGDNLFGETTVPGNITIVVPSEAAVESYTTKLSTAYPSITFKEIVTEEAYYYTNLYGAEYYKDLTTLRNAINFGIGFVSGIKDDASLAAAKALLAGTPTPEELHNAVENYVINLKDDAYYFIISQFDGFRSLGNGANAQNYDGKEAALGYSTKSGVSGSLGNMVSWVVQKREEPNAYAVWRIIKDGDNYKLKNVGSGKYAGAAADGNKIGWTNEEIAQQITLTTEGNFTICNATPASNTNTWKIGGGFHNNSADFIEAATGVNEWGSTNGTERLWRIYELSDFQEDAIQDFLSEKLKVAVGAGVGVAMGMKDAVSQAEAETLLEGTPTCSEIENALDNVLPLTSGYYRLLFPKDNNGDSGNPYVFFGNDKKLTANLTEEEAKKDYSTVWSIDVLSDTYSYIDSKGYEITMTSQGDYRPYYNSSNSVQKEVIQDSNMKAHVIQPIGGFKDGSLGALAIDVTQSSGNYTAHFLRRRSANAIKADYVTSNPVSNGHQAFLVPATDITVNMHAGESYYWATLYVPFGVTLPEGTEAYVGQLGTNSLTLTSIGQKVPAGTPVILKGNAASITATINSTIPEYTEANDLQGQYLAAEAADDTKLSLGISGGKVGFYKYNGAIGANKAFVVAPAGSGSNGFQFTFDDDVTGINEIVNSKSSNSKYYDLYGRKVEAPQKGQLYIVNGKVVKY